MNKTNSSKMTAGKTAIEELAEIVLDDDREELPKDYMEFIEQNNKLYDRLKEAKGTPINGLGEDEEECLRIQKQIAWNDYAMACIEEKMYRIAGIRRTKLLR